MQKGTKHQMIRSTIHEIVKDLATYVTLTTYKAHLTKSSPEQNDVL